MKKNSALAIVIIGLLISSCTVMSFYPLYTNDKLIKNDKIIGRWQSTNEINIGLTGSSNSDTTIWEISFADETKEKQLNNPFDKGGKKIPNQFTYTLNIYNTSNPENNAEFHLHLVKLGDDTYFDFFPEEWDQTNDILAMHLMYVHTFAKVEISDEIEIQWFDSEWLQQMFEDNKIRIKHENNGVYTLLTAKPEELQKFILKYSDNEEAYSEGMTYKLTKI